MALPGDTSYIAGALISDISNDVVVAYSDAGVTSRLAQYEWRAKADTIRITKWNLGDQVINSSDIASHTEGAATSASYLNSDAVTITPAGYTCRVDYTDESDLSNAGDPAGQMAKILGNAVGAKRDNLLNALFDSFTTNTIAASTAALTVDHLYDAFGGIDSSSDGSMPLFGVLYPSQLNGTYGLSNDLVTSPNFTATDAQNSALRTARYGEVAGIDLYRSREFTVADSAVKGGVFRKDAIAIGNVGYSEDAPFKITPQYDADRATWELVAFMFGGVSIVEESYGAEIWTRYTA